MAPATLSLTGVTKRYTGKSGAVTDVLGGIDLEVGEGEFVAILGFSGAGKTTLINTIAGLVEPDGGEILLRGEPVAQVGGPPLPRGVHTTQQVTAIVRMQPGEPIQLGATQSSGDRLLVFTATLSLAWLGP